MTAVERNVKDLFSLEGRVAIVTGAVGHLGSVMSRSLAEVGATVVVTSRDAKSAADFAATLPGSGHAGVGFDPGDTDSIPGFVAGVVERLGRIDVLVNNAYGAGLSDIEHATAEDFDHSYHVGVTAYFLLAREVMRHLRQRSAPGSIINMASIFGVVGNYPDAYQGLPVASPPYYYGVKGAVVQLTRHLAVYWARHGIRVNSISPGHFPRPLKQRIPEFTPRMAKLTPMGRVAQPEELKGAVVLLASDAGSYITGHNLLVDGGWTAW